MSTPPVSSESRAAAATGVAAPAPGGRLGAVMSWEIWCLGLAALATWALTTPLDRYAGSWMPDEPVATTDGWQAGVPVKLTVNVVSADAEDLACASGETVSGVRCEYDGARRPFSTATADRGPSLLQPFSLSPGNATVLLSGLWSQPSVAVRYHQEPTATVPRKRQGRFLVDCDALPQKQLPRVMIRWSPSQGWSERRGLWVVRVDKCHVRRDD